MPKAETLTEYLARGGLIQVGPTKIARNARRALSFGGVGGAQPCRAICGPDRRALLAYAARGWNRAK